MSSKGAIPANQPRDGLPKTTPRTYEEFEALYLTNSLSQKVALTKQSTLRNSLIQKDEESSRPSSRNSPLPPPTDKARPSSTLRTSARNRSSGRATPAANSLDRATTGPARPTSRSSVASSRPDTPPVASSSKVKLPSRRKAEHVSDDEAPGDVNEGVNQANRKSHRSSLAAPISSSSPENTLASALRQAVMARAEHDLQTREERVYPVLLANLSISDPLGDTDYDASNRLITEITNGRRWTSIMGMNDKLNSTLVERFQERQHALDAKLNHLRTEYVTLNRQWQADCAYLEKKERTTDAKQAEVIPIAAGRATRSTRGGDVVATDHDMEQIISVLTQSEMTNPAILCKKNLATIPDMISVTSGPIEYVYDDTNHLVTDPESYYGLKSGLEDWTEDEKETFNDKFAAYPKQFGIIAEYLPNKTAAQCVDYYYLHKKVHIDFRKIVAERGPGGKRRRRGTDKQKGNALLADIRQHDAEVHRGDANVNNKKVAPTRASARILDNGASTATPTPEPESRPKRRKVTSAKPPEEEEEDNAKSTKKPARKPRKSKGLEPERAEPSKRKSASSVTWSTEDKSKFILLLARYGTDFKRIAAAIPNKTPAQVSNFYKANEQSMSLDKVIATDGAGPNSPVSGPSTPLAAPVPVPSKLRMSLLEEDSSPWQAQNVQQQFAFPFGDIERSERGPSGASS